MRHLSSTLTVLLSAALLAAGCGGDTTPGPLPEARPLLEEAMSNIEDAESFEMEISVSGSPVEIQVGDFPLPMDFPLLFQYAKGVFVAPDRMHANVQVSLGQFSTIAEIIALDREQYMRSDLLTQSRWIQQEIIINFSPVAVISAERGISFALKTITGLEMVGMEDLDGLEVFHLQGTIQASNVYSLTFGLMGTKRGELRAEVFILTNERILDQIVFHQPPPADAEAQGPTVWTIRFDDFDTPATITAPAVNGND